MFVMQTCAMKACFQIAECSFASAKIRFSFVTSKKLTKKNSLILDEKRIKHLV